MARLPDISELNDVLKQAKEIAYERHELNESLSGLERIKLRLQESEDKYDRLREIEGPIKEALTHIQTAPKRGFFSKDPFKKHRPILEDFYKLISAIVDDYNHYDTLIKESEEQTQRLAKGKELENKVKLSIQAQMQEENAQRKALANTVNAITQMQRAQAERARANMNKRRQEVNSNLENTMSGFMSNTKGGKTRGGKTRRGRRSSKKTRKH